MSYTQKLARFSLEVKPDDVPERARAAARRLVLDTLGCMVGGRRVASSEAISAVRLGRAGAPEATVAVTGERVDLLSAVHLNAHFANALDAEETLRHSGHLAAAAVPSALAVAEQSGASGAEFLAAVAVGFDVAARVGMSLRPLDTDDRGRTVMSPVIGSSWAAFAATVAAARMLRLRPEHLASAFGITVAGAPMPIAGRWGELRAPRPMTKYGCYGAIAEAGVAGVLLAAAGMDGDQEVLDGDRGFWRMSGSPRCDWDELTRDLGDRWLVEETSYKLYPACQWAVPALDLFQRLARENALAPDEIDRVTVLVPEAAIRKYMAEHEVTTVVDGQFSIPHLIALAAHAGPPGPGWHTARMLHDPRVKAFRARVRVGVFDRAAGILADLIGRQGHAHLIPTQVVLSATGREFSAISNTSEQDQWDFLAAAEAPAVHAKFVDFAGAYLEPHAVTHAVRLVDSIERQPGVNELVACLVAG